MALDFSVVIPCFNEEASLENTVEKIQDALTGKKQFELLIVNDGSTDDTAAIGSTLAKKYQNVKVLTHNRNRGYGAALKSGIRQASGDLIAIIDADDTYPSERIGELIDQCKDYDMVIGARVGENVSESTVRMLPKYILKKWICWIARHDVPDINSGMRVFKKSLFERFVSILPDGFSFTITITLASLTNYCPTYFCPIDYHSRKGLSKIKPIKDTSRFLALILRTGAYFAPLRVFAPVFVVFLLGAVASSLYDIFIIKNLTDKTILLFLFAFNTAMFTLIFDMMGKQLK